MKYVNQHIYDLVSRFRNDIHASNDVFFTGLSNPGSDEDRFLVANSSTGKVGFRTGSEVASDIGAGDTNQTVTIINTTGYFRLFGTIQPSSVAGSSNGNIKITDGTTTKTLFSVLDDGITSSLSVPFDFVVFVEAGDSITVTAGTNCQIQIASRQLADINGNLTNP